MGSKIELHEHQLKAVSQLKVGSVLAGGVGTGKTLTALQFYKENYGDKDLYVITTAKKRNEHDWEVEAGYLDVHPVGVDSWNNISNYTTVRNAFFIFDEQRAVGYGKWAKAFIKIARNNYWIMASATPGDNWIDYMPVFLANNFFRNKSEFIEEHVEYDRFVSYPKIKRYHNTEKLQALRASILVPMKVERHTVRNRIYLETEYDEEFYKDILDKRWNFFLNRPIRTASEMTQLLRRIVSTTPDRMFTARTMMKHNKKIIVFYNYNYELDALIEMCETLSKPYRMYNGVRHESIPDTDEWIYLVQYTAGAEGWNCIETNTILFYSMNYSYKITEQSEGRIDRMNTPFTKLRYYYLTSASPIEKAIQKSIRSKKEFNATAWLKRSGVQF